MANISITDLRAKYVNNFRNKVTSNSTLGTIYHRTNYPYGTNNAYLRPLPDALNNFPILSTPADIQEGSVISVSGLAAIMQQTVSFFGGIRRFIYGVSGNSGDWDGHATGFVTTTARKWRLSSSVFPEIANQQNGSNDEILKSRMATEAAKLLGKNLTPATLDDFYLAMYNLVINTATSVVNQTTDYPDLRICHGSCHVDCHSSVPACHSSVPVTPAPTPAPTTAPPTTPGPTTAPPQTPAPTTAPPWTPAPTPAPTQPPPPPNPLTVPYSVDIYGYNRANTMGNGSATFSLGAGGSWSASVSRVVDYAIFPTTSGRWVNSGYSGSDFQVYWSGGGSTTGNVPSGSWQSLGGGLSITVRNEDAERYSDYISIMVRHRSNPSAVETISLFVSFESNM